MPTVSPTATPGRLGSTQNPKMPIAGERTAEPIAAITSRKGSGIRHHKPGKVEASTISRCSQVASGGVIDAPRFAHSGAPADTGRRHSGQSSVL